MFEADARWLSWEGSVPVWLDHEHSPPPPPAPEKAGRAERGHGGRREEAAAAAEADEIPAGLRNDALLSLGGTMRRRGMRANEIAAALLEVNRGRCRPPLPEDEVRGIAGSVVRYEPDDPLQFATVEPEPGKALLWLGDRLFGTQRVISVRRIVRRGGVGGAVDLELSDGRVVNVGTVATVLSFGAFRRYFADATRIVLPGKVGEDWQDISQLICHVMEDVEGESLPDQIGAFLESVYAADPPVDADDLEEFEGLRVSRRQAFFRRGGRLHVRLGVIMTLNRKHGTLRLSQREFGEELARMGWTPCKLSFGGREERRRLDAYAAPEGWEA